MAENNTGPDKTRVEQVAQNLFDYSVDREDVKWLMDYLSPEADVNRVTVEYELQILKIVSVGWSISYFLENSRNKGRLLASYWQSIRDYSRNLSDTTGLMIGKEIDYFQVLKDRLDLYVAAMANNPEAPEPATVIGPEFAAVCGNKNDIFTYMTGSKMFLTTLSNIRRYLEAMEV